MKVSGFRKRGRARRLVASFEPLERRELLATVTVDAGQVVRMLAPQLLGVNLAWWDTNLNTPQTEQMVQAAGLNMFRFPGGSSSDDFHFNAPPTYNGEGTDASMAEFIDSVGGVGLATVDYGSGSPQEAAAFLAYLEAPVSNTTAIGDGQQWNDTTGAWQTVNWQTAGYWASLRAAAPLAQDDGLNFLRLDHPAPFNVPYWEVGNEEYGSWEIDHHTVQHDPATYIAFAKQFATYAAQIDPGISIGLDVGSPGTDYNNWTAEILQQSAMQGFMPGFLSDHNYVQAPGSESDSNLLLDTVSDPNSSDDWEVRADGYETLLIKYLGTAGYNVQLLATEFNSVSSNPGKQTTSLVNGLFVADSLGELMETSYDGADVWDLRNGYDTTNNNSSSLYGWRNGGDYGLLGSPPPTGVTAPDTGTYVPYPTYFAEQLASKIIQAGGEVVAASSDNSSLSAYAVLEPDGHLDLLVINKSGPSSSSALTEQIQIAGFQPGAEAQVWQYGETQDTAQSQSSDGQSSLADFPTTLTVSGSSFSYTFPAYSMSVLDLSPSSGSTGGPTIVTAAAATPSPVTGTTTVLSVSAGDPAGASGLTYTWATTGTPPGPVGFSVNGTNSAASTTATFSRAGSYTFVVTVTDPSALTATSSVTVTVNQSLTSIKVTPTSPTVSAGTTDQFKAEALDQFGEPLSVQPGFAWSVLSGGGSIGAASGLYAATTTSSSVQVRAAALGVAGKGTVAITPAIKGPVHVFVHYAQSGGPKTPVYGTFTITNEGIVPVDGWVLQFTLMPGIVLITNAAIVSDRGGRYTVKNPSSNPWIIPGGSISFVIRRPPARNLRFPSKLDFNGVPVI
ncbi:MAG: PKD domain-containing protein [Isosphaeraceae bacterium]